MRNFCFVRVPCRCTYICYVGAREYPWQMLSGAMVAEAYTELDNQWLPTWSAFREVSCSAGCIEFGETGGISTGMESMWIAKGIAWPARRSGKEGHVSVSFGRSLDGVVSHVG